MSAPDPRPATGPHILDQVLHVRGLVEPLSEDLAAELSAQRRERVAIAEQLQHIERQLAALTRLVNDLPRTLHAADALAVGDLSHDRT